jgi:hypothetical protein
MRAALPLFATTALAALTCASSSFATVTTVDGPLPVVQPDTTVQDTPPRHRTFGITTDLGLPDGAGVGISIRPAVDWLRIGVAGTYNLMAPGVRVGVTIDPIAFIMAPTFTMEAGHSWAGRLPGSDAPAVGYTYANFHLGIEVGSRSKIRLFLRGGASWIDATPTHLQSGTSSESGAGLLNPSYVGLLVPTAKVGFSTYF